MAALGGLEAWIDASVCSGAGTGALLNRILFEELGWLGETRTAYCCDKGTAQKSVLKNIVHAQKRTCVYEDVKDVAAEDGKAQCFSHRGRCPIPSGKNGGPISFDAGFVCKNLSGLFEDRAAYLDCIEKRFGQTGLTARATVDHSELHQIPIAYIGKCCQPLKPIELAQLVCLAQRPREGWVSGRCARARRAGPPGSGAPGPRICRMLAPPALGFGRSRLHHVDGRHLRENLFVEWTTAAPGAHLAPRRARSHRRVP